MEVLHKKFNSSRDLPPTDEDLLSVDEAVALLPRKMGVSRTTLIRWARKGWVPSVQPVPHSRRFFRRDDILRLLEPRGDTGGESSASADMPLPGLEES